MGATHRVVRADVILLTLRDLAHRRVRFVVVTLLGAVVFALLFVMTGLVEQFNREPYDAVDAIGASTWVLADGIAGPFTAASSLPLATIESIDADRVAPVVAARSSLVAENGDGQEVVLIGHLLGDLGAPAIESGRAAAGPSEAVLDRTAGVDIGSTVTVGGADFEVVGLSSGTTVLAGIPLVFAALERSQQVVFRDVDVVSGFLVDGELANVPDGAVTITSDAVAADTLGPLEGAIASVDLVRALLWVVAAIIVGAVVYLSALERARDFAVLKAVGASTRTLMASLALQAVLVVLVAVAAGALLQMFVAPAFPLEVRVPARAFWQLPVIGVVVALVAGAAGIRRVAGADPALAFAGGA